MHEPDLWKYCTAEHCREMLLSFRLLEGEEWTDDKVISCLYAVSNHTEKHYNRLRIPKKGGGVRQIQAPDRCLRRYSGISFTIFWRGWSCRRVRRPTTEARPSGIMQPAIRAKTWC